MRKNLSILVVFYTFTYFFWIHIDLLDTFTYFLWIHIDLLDSLQPTVLAPLEITHESRASSEFTNFISSHIVSYHLDKQTLLKTRLSAVNEVESTSI